MKTSVSSLEQYCEASGAIPPLFIKMEAENIHQILTGTTPEISHETLMGRLARERRFPPYQELNTGISMRYTDYVGVHQERMHQLVVHLEDEFEHYGNIDIKKLKFGARYHDAPEGISVVGDIPTPIKEAFSPGIREIHSSYERRLIHIVANTILSPEVTGYSQEQMGDLLYEFDAKETLEAQQSSYQDKLDACMVCVHEIQGGNVSFFLEKLKWYKGFFENVATGNDRLKRIHPFFQDIPPTYSKLKEIYNAGKIAQILGDIIWAADEAQRNSIIHDMEVYGIWKDATRQLQDVQVGTQIMNGEQILNQVR